MAVPTEEVEVMVKESVSSPPSVPPVRLQLQFPDLTIPNRDKNGGWCCVHLKAMPAAVAEDGMMGLYRGCGSHLPSSGITWMFYEAWEDVLLSDSPLL